MGRNLFWVTRGSILGRILFNVFLCDLFFIMMNDVEFASYADDNTHFFVRFKSCYIETTECFKNTLQMV